MKNTDKIENETGKSYGFELALDLHKCNPRAFSRHCIDEYFTKLCEAIHMEKCEVYFWDDIGVPIEEQQTSAKTKGTSAVCFILTSTIVIHTLDLLEQVYVNVFSCKEFDPKAAAEFTRNWFEGEIVNSHFMNRA